MNWYKQAQNANMNNLVIGWLRSARDQYIYVPDLMDNMNAIDERILTPDEINNAVQIASQFVANEQGGQLTLNQQDVINQIQLNISSVPNNEQLDPQTYSNQNEIVDQNNLS